MAYQDKQRGTVHSKAEAEAWAKDSIRLAGGPADDLTAGTMGSLGPGFWTGLRIGIYTQTPTALAQFVPGALARGLAAFFCFVFSVLSLQSGWRGCDAGSISPSPQTS